MTQEAAVPTQRGAWIVSDVRHPGSRAVVWAASVFNPETREERHCHYTGRYGVKRGLHREYEKAEECAQLTTDRLNAQARGEKVQG